MLTEREEGGTPNIIGAIRLGLVLHLHVTKGLKCNVEPAGMVMDQAT